MDKDKGVVMWFTGLAGSGKSTLASAVEMRLRMLGLKVENLDADEIRKNLSPDLGYSPKDRDLNTKRLTFMGKLLARNGVWTLIAAVASLREFRDRARREIDQFVEVWVKCPIEECQRRDPKGLFTRAARGEVNDIAGLHQPYEEPLAPEIIVETDQETVERSTDRIMRRLVELGYLPEQAVSGEGYSAEDKEQVERRLRALGYI